LKSYPPGRFYRASLLLAPLGVEGDDVSGPGPSSFLELGRQRTGDVDRTPGHRPNESRFELPASQSGFRFSVFFGVLECNGCCASFARRLGLFVARWYVDG
jgi:hypothetical protein